MMKLTTRYLSALLTLTVCTTLTSQAQNDRSYALLEQQLRQAPVQEKIYLHTDNTCYYKGDTIWYKAYVVRADSLKYTDLSRITYVELLSPDGMLVERQQLITSPDGWTCGSFALSDSIYSGYFELRAYTRWMLNFCVTHHDYSYYDRVAFFTKEMADDFYREYGTVYSRVIPVYERPEEAGEYGCKYIVNRPKMRNEKDLKPRLSVNFYPEGGHLVAGSHCRVAFEAYDEDGQQVAVTGKLGNTTISTEHEGRGLFEMDVPATGKPTAAFTYEGKEYRVSLPDVEPRGYALRLDDDGDRLEAHIAAIGTGDADCAVAVMCRGVLKDFQVAELNNGGKTVVTIDKAKLPTGVCDLIVINSSLHPVADRLFFVNHHDYEAATITVSGLKDEYQPLELATVTLQAPPDARHISVAIRDDITDEPTYDSGNILTELLLSSELQGFIPHPDYYFESDDAEHRRHLDLLMMVQGWRRYNYADMTTTQPLRYEPERSMTVEGRVYAYTGNENFDLGYGTDLVESMESQQTLFPDVDSSVEGPIDDTLSGNSEASEDSTDGTQQEEADSDLSTDDSNSGGGGNAFYKRRRLKHEVTVRSELTLGTEVAEAEAMTTDGGHFLFNVPAFYGDGVLFLMAYKGDDPEKVKKYLNKGWLDEKAIANYYVKRDLFYPIFPKKYSYYQCHLPVDSLDEWVDDGIVPEGEKLSKMDRTLETVTVKSRRRRGRRGVDYTKPAVVMDTHELYNLGVDYGLNYGYYSFRAMPELVTRLLLGTHGEKQFVIKTYLDNQVAGRASSADAIMRSTNWYETNMMLKRQDDTAIYTDLEPRNPDKPHVHPNSKADDPNAWEVMVQFRLVPDDGKRPTYRDRRIILHGFHEPDEFYHRNYSQQPLPDSVKDYRRTLYWNPNARLDEDGRFTATFYNNNKLTHMRVSSAGLTANGQPVYNLEVRNEN